jgi:hypothetical protein
MNLRKLDAMLFVIWLPVCVAAVVVLDVVFKVFK